MDARLDLIENPLEQWQAFGAEHRTRIAGDAQWALPWMLDSASLEAVASLARPTAPALAAAVPRPVATRLRRAEALGLTTPAMFVRLVGRSSRPDLPTLRASLNRVCSCGYFSKCGALK